MSPRLNIHMTSFLFFFLFKMVGTGIEIGQIIPFKDSDELKCDVLINDLFNTKTQSVLMSGISIHLIVSARLLDNHRNQLSINESEVKIDYDVWNQMFLVHYLNSHAQFSSYDSLKADMRRLKAIVLSPLSQLNKDQDFYVLMNIRVYNDQSNRLIDSIDHESSSKKFTLGSIIRFFFGSSGHPNDWFQSEKFNLNELPLR